LVSAAGRLLLSWSGVVQSPAQSLVPLTVPTNLQSAACFDLAWTEGFLLAVGADCAKAEPTNANMRSIVEIVLFIAVTSTRCVVISSLTRPNQSIPLAAQLRQRSAAVTREIIRQCCSRACSQEVGLLPWLTTGGSAHWLGTPSAGACAEPPIRCRSLTQ